MAEDKYYVLKDSGTYSNALEAYGLAELLRRINSPAAEIRIDNSGVFYEVTVKNPNKIELKYFDLFPYIKTKAKKTNKEEGDEGKNQIEDRISNFIDMEEEKAKNKRFNEFIRSISDQKREIRKNPGDRANEILSALDKKINDYEEKPRSDWDIITSISVLKAIDTYKKIYVNLFQNKEAFKEIIDNILELYSAPVDNREKIRKNMSQLKKSKVLKDVKDADCLQLFNPSMVKGAHSPKANSITPKAKEGFWLNECIKILGSYSSMVMRGVKVSSKDSDNKIYVFDVNRLIWDADKKREIFNKFKSSLRGYTSIKLDINSLLILTEKLIRYHSAYEETTNIFRRKYRPKDEINGFYAVYFKNMGNASSPTNISYLEMPGFIELESNDDAQAWLSIIQEHLSIINNIKIAITKQDETGSIIPLLQAYRMFLTTGDIGYFFDFVSEYSVFLMQQIIKENYYVRPLTSKNMEVLLMKYDKKLGSILQNEGFKNIAKAIRSSTISEQYAKSKGKQNFEIKYGLAQDLIRKSAYKDEFIMYLSEFVVSYNQETARSAEKNKKARRATIKQQDLEDIVRLIDEYEDSSLIGRMLCAYGYSLDRKSDEQEQDDTEEIVND